MSQMGGDEARNTGPVLRMRPFGNGPGAAQRLALTSEQREELARIAKPVRFARGQTVYMQDDPLTHVYDLVSGVVATYRVNHGGERHITAILFGGDLFGLSEAGHYVNTAEAITSAEAWRMPFAELERVLEADPKLEWNFLAKACDALRQAQRHAILLERQGATQRVALFLEYLQRENPATSGRLIPLRMPRSVIADFAGLSVESVSRSLSSLKNSGAIRMDGPHAVEILDPALLRDADQEE